MKKYLSICLLLTGITLGLQSCLFSEEDIFDDSSANRLTADVIKCREILQSVPKWLEVGILCRRRLYYGRNYLIDAF